VDEEASPSQDAAVASERQAVWDAAVNSSAFLRSVWDSAPDALVLSDAEGIVRMVNPAYCTLYGYDPDELLGHSFALIFPAEQRRWAQERYRVVFDGGNATPMHETWIRRKDGTSRFVQARAELVIQERHPRAMLSIIRDVTERWVLEQAQREFLAVASHELRNPLTLISGVAQLMRRRGAYDERAVDRVVAQAAHMERLLGDLLSAASLEAGRLELVRGPVDLIALARCCVEQMRSQTERHVIRLEAERERMDGMWDADRLGQVIDNLLSNAVKYSPTGGEIVVRVEETGGAARVSVRDHGVGIPTGALNRIFDRFYRADGHATDTNGFGIGLFVAKSIVELHGGQIEVASEPDRGSTFSFTVPHTPGTG